MDEFSSNEAQEEAKSTKPYLRFGVGDLCFLKSDIKRENVFHISNIDAFSNEVDYSIVGKCIVKKGRIISMSVKDATLDRFNHDEIKNHLKPKK